MPIVKKFPTSSAGTTTGGTSPGSYGTWANPNNIFATDGANATSGYWWDPTGTYTTDSGLLKGSGFGFALPSTAVIDGIQVDIVGSGSLIGSVGIGIGNNSKSASGSGSFSIGGTTGGPTDLWGRTDWTAADINDSSFYASLDASASHDPADANASVDSIAVTVYYHLGGSTEPADVPTREIYKVYNKNGQYIGTLPQPKEPLKLAQDINSLGSQITINVPVSADTSAEQSEAYTTEDGSQTYTTEDGSANYVAANKIPIVSAGFQGIDTLIKNGNTVQVWLYNYWYPNGKCMFIGKIRKWDADFGFGTDSDTVGITLYSTGYDMDNYITRGLPFTLTNDQTQTSQNTSGTINNTDKGFGQAYGQTFRINGATNIGGITVKLNGAAHVSVGLYDAPNGNLIASTRQYVNTGGAAADTVFYMPTSIPVTPGTSYFFSVSVDVGESILIYYQNTDVYSYGSAYNLNVSIGWGVVIFGPITGDLYFKVASGVPNTTTTFSSKDPTTGMLEPIIDDYNARGGSQTYTTDTIDATGLSLTYTFKVQTIYEALQAILSLAPDGFYYYLDLGQQLLYFKNQSTTPDFTLTKGVEIGGLNVVSTTENSINDLLFTGGDTGGGTNLYKEYKDITSIGAYGPLLDRKTDSRVTLSATADAIGQSEIAQRADEQNQTTITIAHTKRLDITQLVPGKTISFRGYGTFIEQMVLQIVHREWSAESVTLTLGLLPKRLTYSYENTTRQLIAAQTQDNPTSPS